MAGGTCIANVEVSLWTKVDQGWKNQNGAQNFGLPNRAHKVRQLKKTKKLGGIKFCHHFAKYFEPKSGKSDQTTTPPLPQRHWNLHDLPLSPTSSPARTAFELSWQLPVNVVEKTFKKIFLNLGYEIVY